MATLGKWSGGTVSSLIPTTTWAAPNGMFPTQDRNDASTYSFNSASSTVTLPATGLADGYLVVAFFEFEDSSNGRHMPQGRFNLTGGTGTLVTGYESGYNRDNSEDRAYVRTWGVYDSPTASSTIQFQWQRDSDSPNTTDGTVRSEFQVIPLYYSNIGMYRSTTAALYGGTTPNQVTGFTAARESDTNAIELATNVVTVKGDNKRYLCFGCHYQWPYGTSRTQRWGGFEIDGTFEDAAKSCAYSRNGSNDEAGGSFYYLLETVTANRTIEMNLYRGDGVAALQGGADVDGSTPTSANFNMVVIELNDSAEVFATHSTANSANLATTGPVDLNIATTTGVDFNDSASFTRASDTAINAEQAMDALLMANVGVASNAITTGQRWTAYSEITVNGTEDSDSANGNYNRNNQSSQDTFGWSANLCGFQALSLNDDIGVSVTELSGSEGGGGNQLSPSGWIGFFGINLDTLQAATAYELTLDNGSYTSTGSVATLAFGGALTADNGSYALTGSAQTGVYTNVVSGTSGTYTVTGSDATLTAPTGFDITADNGSYTLTGEDATSAVDYELPLDAGVYTLTGSAADLATGFAESLESGSYSYIGEAATLLYGRAEALETGAYTVMGSVATLAVGTTLSGENGAYTLTGSDTELAAGASLAADTGVYTLTGTDATLDYVQGFSIEAENGAYSTTGSAATLVTDYALTADNGSYAMIGIDTTLIYSVAISAENGTYNVTGTAATLTTDYALTATSGSYTVTGTDALLTYAGASEIIADPGSYSVIGSAATLVRSYSALAADNGAYTLTGSTQTGVYTTVVDGDSGTYTQTGSDATLATSQPALTAENGAYTLTGIDATLTYNAAATLTADNGAYTLTGSDATLDWISEVLGDEGVYSLTGSDAILTVGPTLALDNGSYTVTGMTVTMAVGYQVTADNGLYSYIGTEASLNHVVAGAIEAQNGAYALTGSDATLTYVAAAEITADNGLYGITGTEVLLTYSPAVEQPATPGWGRYGREDDGRNYQLAYDALNRRGRQRRRSELRKPVREAIEQTIAAVIDTETKERRARPDLAMRKIRDRLRALKRLEKIEKNINARELVDILAAERAKQVEKRELDAVMAIMTLIVASE